MKKIHPASKRRETRQKDESWFQVRSQTSSFDLWYDVLLTETGLKCDCPEYSNSNLKCKHIFAIENRYPQTRTEPVQEIKEEIEIVKTINPISIKCRKCYSADIKRDGIRKNRNQIIQKYRCNICSAWFSGKLGFKNMHASPETITLAMQLYFTGESFRNISKALKLRGLNFTHVSIYKWIKRYTKLLDTYAKTITPKVGSKWHADEAWVKIRGDQKYMFAMMDNKTRFWIAQEVADSKFKHDTKSLLELGRDLTGITPDLFVTDGLPAYHDSFKKVFAGRKRKNSPKHIRDVHFKHQLRNNNIQERLNGEFRDREKIFRGLKKTESPAFSGMQFYHNFIRTHQGLDGDTPADRAGIRVNGSDKWQTMIGNASEYDGRQ